MNRAVAEVTLANYPLLRRGKVRDVFDLGDNLLLVPSDRISAFDVVLPSLLPGKGAVLTGISRFWFDQISGMVHTQMTGAEIDSLDLIEGELEQLAGRSVIVRKAERIDIECVMRAYLAGTAWKEYVAEGTVAGIPMPAGMQRGDRLPEVLFAPAIKNDEGHDENISTEQLRSMVGEDLASRLETLSRRIFEVGTDIAATAGFQLADTKFEFGWIDGELAVIDEVLTPDSSRYWDFSEVIPGKEPPAYDKQIIRDWLEGTGWDKTPPGPELPADIIEQAMARYRAVETRLRDSRGDNR